MHVRGILTCDTIVCLYKLCVRVCMCVCIGYWKVVETVISSLLKIFMVALTMKMDTRNFW